MVCLLNANQFIFRYDLPGSRNHCYFEIFLKTCIVALQKSQLSMSMINVLVFSKHFVVGVALPRIGVATDVPSHLGGLGKSPLPENFASLDSWRYIF